MAVVYCDQWLPGTIVKVLSDDMIEVKFMSVFGPNRFIWQEKDDVDVIPFSTILTMMKNSPDLVSFRGRAIYSIPAHEFTRILDVYLSVM